MPKKSTEMMYRAVHVTRRLRDRQVGQSQTGSTLRSGIVRLAALPWRHAITLLLDWDRAVYERWPDVRSPSCFSVKTIWRLGRGHQVIRQFAGNGNNIA